MTTNTDQYYINKIRSGNTDAFSFLVEKYKDLVYTLAVRMLRDRVEAEEIAQDVFVKVYRSINAFKGNSKFSTWLYKICYNSCVDHLKRKKRMINSDLIDEVNEGNLGVEQNALDYLEEMERTDVLKKAILLLPDDYRTVITLFYFNELNLQEISEVTGTNPNLLKIRLHRARKKLYELLKGKTEFLNVKNYGESLQKERRLLCPTDLLVV